MKKELFVEAEIQIIPIDSDKSVLCCSNDPNETQPYPINSNT